MQETRVRSLVQEDSTCLGAAKATSHNYLACMLQFLKLTRLEPVLHNKRRHPGEKPAHSNEEYPLLTTTGESLSKVMKAQHTQKNQINNNLKKDHPIQNSPPQIAFQIHFLSVTPLSHPPLDPGRPIGFAGFDVENLSL